MCFSRIVKDQDKSCKILEEAFKDIALSCKILQNTLQKSWKRRIFSRLEFPVSVATNLWQITFWLSVSFQLLFDFLSTLFRQMALSYAVYRFVSITRFRLDKWRPGVRVAGPNFFLSRLQFGWFADSVAPVLQFPLCGKLSDANFDVNGWYSGP